MADNIETFVAKLQAEGVQAGRTEAEAIRQEAREQAEAIVAQARSEAQKIVADAETQAEGLLQRGRTELELASRDAVLRLREALRSGLEAVIAAGVREKLEDVEFLGQILHELILQYARSDLKDKHLDVNVSPELKQKLVAWALSEVGHDIQNHDHVSIDLKGTLRQAGFEYEATGATVEVTLDAVVEVLTQMVTPALHDVLQTARSQVGPVADKPTDQQA